MFKPVENFREPFSVANSDAAILRFPFPFRDDRYNYGVNLEPHGALFDVYEHYVGEVREREIVLAGDGARCFVPAELEGAGWEVLALVMTGYARDFPAWFELLRDRDDWCWRNRVLGVEQVFRYGAAGTLPCGALEYVARQAQGDFALLEQREGVLVLRGGVVTAAAGWSFAGNLGKSFYEIHAPVPLAGEMGVFDRAQKVLARLSVGRPVRRTGWSVTVGPRLDISAENEGVWRGDKAGVTAGNVGEKVWLRVELQSLFRLAGSGAILFSIRTYMLRLDEVARVRKWGVRLHRVMRDLHPEIVIYKGLEGLRPLIVGYLAGMDDGAVLGAGVGAEQTSL